MNLTRKHYAILAALLVSLGTQLAGVQHGWADVSSPTFIGGCLMQIGTTIAAIYVGAPQKDYIPGQSEDRRTGSIDPSRFISKEGV